MKGLRSDWKSIFRRRDSSGIVQKTRKDTQVPQYWSVHPLPSRFPYNMTSVSAGSTTEKVVPSQYTLTRLSWSWHTCQTQVCRGCTDWRIELKSGTSIFKLTWRNWRRTVESLWFCAEIWTLLIRKSTFLGRKGKTREQDLLLWNDSHSRNSWQRDSLTHIGT